MPGKTRWIFFLVALAAALAAAAAENRAPVIDFSGYTALVDSDRLVLLIDGRSRESYRYGHLPGAVNFPGYLFDRQEPIAGLPEDRTRPIIVYCGDDHCGISDYVTQRLLDMGYEHVYVYEEGVNGWIKRGQRLIRKRHEALPRIDAAELAALPAKPSPARLVDARSPEEVRAETIGRATPLLPDQVKPGAAELPPDRRARIVVFGAGAWDSRPYHVADRLRMIGYKNVRLFAPGLSGWRRYQSIRK
ncbi:MAG: rhodanese-like domain-containing protein [Candidatus Lernaella stagnicola]|nr:rhodanese-like domain-containing protein [Candidatus Lernaella stagnicola]